MEVRPSLAEQEIGPDPSTEGERHATDDNVCGSGIGNDADRPSVAGDRGTVSAVHAAAILSASRAAVSPGPTAFPSVSRPTAPISLRSPRKTARRTWYRILLPLLIQRETLNENSVRSSGSGRCFFDSYWITQSAIMGHACSQALRILANPGESRGASDAAVHVEVVFEEIHELLDRFFGLFALGFESQASSLLGTQGD